MVDSARGDGAESQEREVESSSAWNNAGTGHAALCELSYTPARSDWNTRLRAIIPSFGASLIDPRP
jgi:hypothetical protein